MKQGIRVAIYTRVSTAGQAKKQARRDDEDRWTLPAQRRALTDECRRQSWTVAAEFCDAGISGETLTERPDMTRLLDEVRAGRFDFVLAIEWERFSRSQHGRDWSVILTAAEEGGAKLAVPGQVLDPTSPEDSFLGGLFGLLAAREKRKMIQRTSRGIRERVRNGKWWGSYRPFGYRVGADGKLVPDAKEATIVRRVFDETRAGMGLCDIAAGLNRDAVPTHKGGREWFPTAIRRVLTNPVYTGALVYGRTTKNPRGGAPVRVEGAHEAIVPLHVFEAVQTYRAARQRAGCPPSRWGQGYILTGLLACPTCGGRMYGGSSGTARGPNRRFYGHNRSRMPDAVKCHKVRADALEQAVLAAIASALRGPDVVEAVRRELVNERLRDGTDDSKRRSELEEMLAKEEQRAKTLYQDRVDGVVTPVQFSEWNAGSAERQTEIKNEIHAIEDRLLSMGRHIDVEALLANLRDLPRALKVLTPRETKQLLWEVVREVRLRDAAKGTVSITFRLPGLSTSAAARRASTA